jgi:hypothetical protein
VIKRIDALQDGKGYDLRRTVAKIQHFGERLGKGVKKRLTERLQTPDKTPEKRRK